MGNYVSKSKTNEASNKKSEICHLSIESMFLLKSYLNSESEERTYMFAVSRRGASRGKYEKHQLAAGGQEKDNTERDSGTSRWRHPIRWRMQLAFQLLA